MKKSFLVVAIAAVSSFTVVSCKAKQESSETEVTQEVVEEAPAATETPAATEAEAVEKAVEAVEENAGHEAQVTEEAAH